MKKLLIVAAAVLWAGTAFAKHERNNQRCYDCHTMHASISHDYAGGNAGVGSVTVPFEGTGYANLLQQNGTNATCLGCHNDTVLDTPVWGDTTDTRYSTGTRSGGALNGVVNGRTILGTYSDWMGHTLGSLLPPPGFSNTNAWPTTGQGLNCANCHAVHGGATNSFRHLGGVADMGWDGVKYSASNPFLTNYPTKNPVATFDATYDVTVVANAAVTGSRDARRVVYGLGGNGMNAYCGVCHGDFHGTANTGSAADFVRHPTTGVTRTAASWFVTGAQVGSVTAGGVVRPVWADATGTTFQVGCTTCHKAHGNKHAFALIWPTNAGDAAAINYESGDGAVFQDLCATCHVQARTTAAAGTNGFTPSGTFDNGVRP